MRSTSMSSASASISGSARSAGTEPTATEGVAGALDCSSVEAGVGATRRGFSPTADCSRCLIAGRLATSRVAGGGSAGAATTVSAGLAGGCVNGRTDADWTASGRDGAGARIAGAAVLAASVGVVPGRSNGLNSGAVLGAAAAREISAMVVGCSTRPAVRALRSGVLGGFDADRAASWAGWSAARETRAAAGPGADAGTGTETSPANDACGTSSSCRACAAGRIEPAGNEDSAIAGAAAACAGRRATVARALGCRPCASGSAGAACDCKACCRSCSNFRHASSFDIRHKASYQASEVVAKSASARRSASVAAAFHAATFTLSLRRSATCRPGKCARDIPRSARG